MRPLWPGWTNSIPALCGTRSTASRSSSWSVPSPQAKVQCLRPSRASRFRLHDDSPTRFATELVLRRSDETAVKVTLQTADGSPCAMQGKVAALASRLPCFDNNSLSDIIRETRQLLKLGDGEGNKLSKDVLRVEIAGPKLHPLHLVDLPGLSDAAADGQGAEGDFVVDDLFRIYLNRPSTIILAVVPATDLATRCRVLRRVKKHDPNVEHTIGIVFEFDLRGGKKPPELPLSWYALSNTEHDLSSEIASENESLNKPTEEVGSLRRKLSQVLFDCTKARLPGFIREIELRLKAHQQALDQLGKEKSSPDELRVYLLGIADRFHRLARDGLEGRYGDKFFGDLNHEGTNMKLRAVLRNLNRAFDVILSTKGARPHHAEYLQPFCDLYKVTDPEPITESDLRSRLRLLASDNQGMELPGVLNRDLVLKLFKLQAKRWHRIGQVHLDQVLTVAKAFVERVGAHLTGDDGKTSKAILVEYVDRFFDEKREILQTKLQALLAPYTSGYGFSLERHFHARACTKATQQHQTAELVGPMNNPFPFGPSKSESNQALDRATACSVDDRSDQFGTAEVIDMMLAYYRMSMNTFVHNVVNLAVEGCLVWDIPTIFTPKTVAEMSTARLVDLASESEELRAIRRRLQDEVAALREALQVCKEHKPREPTEQPKRKIRRRRGQRRRPRLKIPGREVSLTQNLEPLVPLMLRLPQQLLLQVPRVVSSAGHPPGLLREAPPVSQGRQLPLQAPLPPPLVLFDQQPSLPTVPTP
ncbi:hypothetical protein N658DRAFT_519189 [Parathielavia hyrcaniae]|uniref:GED domain-containing protein n=1 Tax=Parathielavia hyrcaniae TaxID=113614 RepID=A0AAN6SXH0_9PEZI|nr:hypothetical protein N658DRAFT_519189 [Parathielavia hyrcaniae]